MYFIDLPALQELLFFLNLLSLHQHHHLRQAFHQKAFLPPVPSKHKDKKYSKTFSQGDHPISKTKFHEISEVFDMQPSIS